MYVNVCTNIQYDMHPCQPTTCKYTNIQCGKHNYGEVPLSPICAAWRNTHRALL